jgi:hypothetical protein
VATYERKVLNFTSGLNTTALSVTSKPVWREMSEANIDRVACQRRLGKLSLYQFPVVATICNFDGVNDRIAIPHDTRIFPLGTRFTVKTLFVVDTINVDRFVIGRNGAAATWLTVKQTTTSTVVAVITDSAGTATTLTWTGIAAGTVCALMIAREGATVRGVLNGTVQTGTMSATLSLASGVAALGTDNGASFLDGAVDHLTILKTYETSQVDGWIRHLNPRAENVLADWLVALDANDRMQDRGRFEVVCASTGTPATNRTPLCLNPDPIVAFGLNLDSSGSRQGYAVVGDRVYPVKVN